MVMTFMRWIKKGKEKKQNKRKTVRLIATYQQNTRTKMREKKCYYEFQVAIIRFQFSFNCLGFNRIAVEMLFYYYYVFQLVPWKCQYKKMISGLVLIVCFPSKIPTNNDIKTENKQQVAEMFL